MRVPFHQRIEHLLDETLLTHDNDSAKARTIHVLCLTIDGTAIDGNWNNILDALTRAEKALGGKSRSVIVTARSHVRAELSRHQKGATLLVVTDIEDDECSGHPT